MANGLLGYQQQSELGASLKRIREAQEQEFMGDMLKDQLDGVGDVYIDDGKPQFSPGLMDYRNKDAALNAYLQFKKGRVTDAEILAFNEQWKAMQGMRQQKEVDNLNRLSTMGLSDAKVRNFVGNNPALYGSVVDRILALEGMGDEGMASAALLRSKFLPEQTWGEWMGENPLTTGAIGIGLPVAAASAWGGWAYPYLKETYGVDPAKLKEYKAYGDNFVKNEQGKWESTTKQNKDGSPRKANAQQVKKLERLARQSAPRGRNILAGLGRATPGMAMGTALQVAPYQAGNIGRAIGGETGEDIGQVAGGTFAAGRGLAGLAKSPLGKYLAGVAARHSAANVGAGGGPVGWGGMQTAATLMDLYFGGKMLYDAFAGE